MTWASFYSKLSLRLGFTMYFWRLMIQAEKETNQIRYLDTLQSCASKMSMNQNDKRGMKT